MRTARPGANGNPHDKRSSASQCPATPERSSCADGRLLQHDARTRNSQLELASVTCLLAERPVVVSFMRMRAGGLKPARPPRHRRWPQFRHWGLSLPGANSRILTPPAARSYTLRRNLALLLLPGWTFSDVVAFEQVENATASTFQAFLDHLMGVESERLRQFNRDAPRRVDRSMVIVQIGRAGRPAQPTATNLGFHRFASLRARLQRDRSIAHGRACGL
jgi:hypothetical protein